MKYRRPFGTEWEELGLDTAMDMIADRVQAPAVTAGSERWMGTGPGRTPGFAGPGGAILDNEENYLIKSSAPRSGRD